jgi:glycosyltransferase involved in cell wall biosynthesis
MSGKAAIITAFDPFSFRGGIETYTLQLIGLLRRYSVSCDVISQTPEEGGRRDFHNNYLERLYRMGRRFPEGGGDYDFVIANAFYGLGYFPPKKKAFNIFHLTHKGFAEEIKEVVPLSQYLEWKLLWGELAESASGFGRTKIAVSWSVREELESYYGFQDVAVLPNCVDTKVFVKVDRLSSRRKWGIPHDLTVGLYVGRWDVLKGCDILEGTISRTPDIHWVIVLGTGSDPNAVPCIGNVQVIEQAAHEDMRELYSAADFMLFPSRYEGFGYVIIEALACGLPVVTTNVGIAKTIYRIAPFDRLLLPDISFGGEALVLSAVDKIAQVTTDAGLRESVSSEGRHVVERDFDIARWNEGVVKVLGLP